MLLMIHADQRFRHTSSCRERRTMIWFQWIEGRVFKFSWLVVLCVCVCVWLWSSLDEHVQVQPEENGNAPMKIVLVCRWMSRDIYSIWWYSSGSHIFLLWWMLILEIHPGSVRRWSSITRGTLPHCPRDTNEQEEIQETRNSVKAINLSVYLSVLSILDHLNVCLTGEDVENDGDDRFIGDNDLWTRRKLHRYSWFNRRGKRVTHRQLDEFVEDRFERFYWSEIEKRLVRRIGARSNSKMRKVNDIQWREVRKWAQHSTALICEFHREVSSQIQLLSVERKVETESIVKINQLLFEHVNLKRNECMDSSRKKRRTRLSSSSFILMIRSSFVLS